MLIDLDKVAALQFEKQWLSGRRAGLNSGNCLTNGKLLQKQS